MVRLTGEYLGGILAGFGLGVLLHGYFVIGIEEMFEQSGEWLIAAFVLIGVGATVARAAQRRVKEKHSGNS
jgi:hypothetical protein